MKQHGFFSISIRKKTNTTPNKICKFLIVLGVFFLLTKVAGNSLNGKLIVSKLVITHEWERTNPGGGGSFGVVGASLNGTIYVGSDLSGVYRSVDGGFTWDVLGFANGLTETHISALGFHVEDANIVFVGTENGIFRSDNGGDNFLKVLDRGYITDIKFGLANSDIGYAAFHSFYNSTDGIVWKSTDRGLTWTKVSTDLPSGIRILKIVVSPQNADIVYLLTGQDRFACGPANVFKSIDGGKTWRNITEFFNQEIMDFEIDKNNPNTLYLTTFNADCNAVYYWTDLEGGLYKSTDGGANWAYLSDFTGVIFLDSDNRNNITLIDPREPYPWNERAGTFISEDGGVSFRRVGNVEEWDTFFNRDPYWCYSASYNGITKTFGTDPSNRSNIFWVTNQWVFVSRDKGKTFENVFTEEVSPGFWKSRGLDNVNMMDVSISKANPQIVFLAYFDMGIWRSLDGGESWQSCNHSVYTGSWEGHGGNCATVLTDPVRPNVVWASQSENQNGEYPTYLLKSENTGERESWVLANSGLPEEQIMGLSLDPNSNVSNRTLYVTANLDVYKSIDDGMSWTKVFDCDGCRFTAVDYFDGNIVYAGGEKGIWCSKDGGITWTNISHPEMISENGSVFWDYHYEGIFDIKTDPNTPNMVYVTVLGFGKGLYKSTDNGRTWKKLLTDNYMRKVAIAPFDSNYIYATSSSAFQAGGYSNDSNGVWFSKDGGKTWERHNYNMSYPFALAIEVSIGEQPTVFVGSPGTGFQKSKIYKIYKYEIVDYSEIGSERK